MSHITYNDEAWHSYTLTKEDPKNIWIMWYIPWDLKIVLINMVATLMMSAKMTTLTSSQNKGILE